MGQTGTGLNRISFCNRCLALILYHDKVSVSCLLPDGYSDRITLPGMWTEQGFLAAFVRAVSPVVFPASHGNILASDTALFCV